MLLNRVVFYNLFESLTALTGAVSTLTDHCITGITADRERCRTLMEASAGIATALCPYHRLSEICRNSQSSIKIQPYRPRTGTGRTPVELPLNWNRFWDPYAMTETTTDMKQAM